MEGYVLFGLISAAVVGGFTSYFASQRGRDPVGWFFIGFLFNSYALITLFLLDPLNRKKTDSTPPIPAGQEPIPQENLLQEWFYLKKDRSQGGPISFHELKNLWANSEIDNRTFIWCEGMESWQRLEELPDIFAKMN